MRRVSDQRSSDAADQEPSEDIAVPVEQKFESPFTEEADQKVDEALEVFDGLMGHGTTNGSRRSMPSWKPCLLRG